MGAPGPARCYDAFEIDGQRYVWAGDYAHTRRDGKISIMASWETKCRNCSAPFILHHPQRPAPTYPVRNCPACVVLIRAEKAKTSLNLVTPKQIKHGTTHPAKEAREAYHTQPEGITPRVTVQDYPPHQTIPQNTKPTTPTNTQPTRNNATTDGQSEPRPSVSSHQTPVNTASQTPPDQPSQTASTPRRVFTDR